MCNLMPEVKLSSVCQGNEKFPFWKYWRRFSCCYQIKSFIITRLARLGQKRFIEAALSSVFVQYLHKQKIRFIREYRGSASQITCAIARIKLRECKHCAKTNTIMEMVTQYRRYIRFFYTHVIQFQIYLILSLYSHNGWMLQWIYVRCGCGGALFGLGHIFEIGYMRYYSSGNCMMFDIEFWPKILSCPAQKSFAIEMRASTRVGANWYWNHVA